MLGAEPFIISRCGAWISCINTILNRNSEDHVAQALRIRWQQCLDTWKGKLVKGDHRLNPIKRTFDEIQSHQDVADYLQTHLNDPNQLNIQAKLKRLLPCLESLDELLEFLKRCIASGSASNDTTIVWSLVQLAVKVGLLDVALRVGC